MFRRYWFASFASVGATQLVILGQGWLIFKLTGSALELGYLGAAASIPAILLTILGGSIADRFDKRKLLLLASALNVLLLSLMALLDFFNLVAVWHVLGIAMLISFVTGIDWPTRQAFFPHLIKRDGMLSAVALGSFIWQSTRMTMPALGGFIIAFWNTWSIFALAALGYVYMFVTIQRMKISVPGEKKGSTWYQTKQGIRYILDHEIFAWLILVSMMTMFFGNAYTQIMPVFANLLGSDERGYGYLLSASGMGSILGTLIIVNAQHSARLGRMIVGGTAGVGLGLLAFSLAVSYGSIVLALCCALLTASFNSIMMVSSMTVVQMSVPDNMRGRVNGMHSVSFSMIPLGGLFLGMLANFSSAPSAVMLGASVCIIFAVYVYLKKPVIREIDGREIHSLPIQ